MPDLATRHVDAKAATSGANACSTEMLSVRTGIAQRAAAVMLTDVDEILVRGPD